MRRLTAMTLLGGMLLAVAPATLTAQESAGKDDKAWGYDKGLYFRADGFSIKFGIRPQFLYSYLSPDVGVNTNEFQVRRLKFFASGWAYMPYIRYKVQFNAVGGRVLLPIDTDGDGEFDDLSVDGNKSFDLEDAYLDYARSDKATFRAGQFKVPFGIQFMTSSGRQQFVERAIANVAFVQGRDVGIGLHGRFGNKRFGYETSLFNGNGRNRTGNDNDELGYSARIHFDSAGGFKLAESATAHPEAVEWTVGAAWLDNPRDILGELDRNVLEGFLALRFRRISLLADYFERSIEQAMEGEVDSDGYIGQLGLFIVRHKFEIAVRYSEFDPDTTIDNDSTIESRVALNYFIKAHRMKFQVDYGTVTQETPMAADMDIDQIRAQFQIIF